MTELTQAQAGDQEAFTELVRPFRGELQVHCYRLLGSLQDAEEAVQETLLSAWQGIGRFEERSSVRTWLYRIATNRCLDLLRAAERRIRVSTPLRIEPPEPSRMSEISWLQPYPDDLLDPTPGPELVAEQREALSLAYVRALQVLPPRQRVVLVLRDVLAFRASEVAAMLDITEEAVTSALKRARASLADDQRRDQPHDPPPPPRSPLERQVVDAWLAAFEVFDIPKLVELLSEDAWLRMPPLPFEYQGRQAITQFFEALYVPGRILRCLPTRANGQPAYGTYSLDPVSGRWHAGGLFVMTLAAGKVCDVTRFEPALFAFFGLPRVLHD